MTDRSRKRSTVAKRRRNATSCSVASSSSEPSIIDLVSPKGPDRNFASPAAESTIIDLTISDSAVDIDDYVRRDVSSGKREENRRPTAEVEDDSDFDVIDVDDQQFLFEMATRLRGDAEFARCLQEEEQGSADGSVQLDEPFRSSCFICFEDDQICVQGLHCTHNICLSCMRQYINVALESAATKIPLACPEPKCTAEIEPNVISRTSLMPKIKQEMFELFHLKAKLKQFSGDSIMFCPNPKCGNLFEMNAPSSTEDISDGIRLKCPHCDNPFCSRCRIAWHKSMSCKEVSRLKKLHGGVDQADIDLAALAEKQNWQRCSRCNALVSKTQGCDHMTCTCGHHFCYICGKDYPQSCHGNCAGAYTQAAQRGVAGMFNVEYMLLQMQMQMQLGNFGRPVPQRLPTAPAVRRLSRPSAPRKRQRSERSKRNRN